ncbi:hypothetical protein Leryth_013078 [Lithospermum erythrorhizon]|nr:hypothetical protein Leryth_013078 [Lithospermum erythrorhizon]
MFGLICLHTSVPYPKWQASSTCPYKNEGTHLFSHILSKSYIEIAKMSDNCQCQHCSGIPVYNGEHYRKWAATMKQRLQSCGLLECIKDGAVYNSDKNRKALYLIHKGLSKNFFDWIGEVKGAKEAWDIIKKKAKRHKYKRYAYGFANVLSLGSLNRIRCLYMPIVRP